MILDKCFKKEWIQDRSNHFKRGKAKADPELIEKVIYALELLEKLAYSEMEFIFKGGTCLLLLLEKVNRFSIDIDIIANYESKDKMEYFLENIVKGSTVFYKYEENIRGEKSDIPKAHYKFFYNSDLDGQEKYILLDVLLENNPYFLVEENEIKCEFITSKETNIAKVRMPSKECILGDKLTAFAPNTTGIPYGVGKEVEIIKQLYDVSNLFDEAEDLDLVRRTFIDIAKQELEYRGLDNDYNDVLDDIFKTSLNIASKGKIDLNKFKELEIGVTRIKSYIFSSNFIIENAIGCSAKAAYLSRLIKNNEIKFERFNNKIKMDTIVISDDNFSKAFKGIKKFSPEAYYYLYKALEINSKLIDEVAVD